MHYRTKRKTFHTNTNMQIEFLTLALRGVVLKKLKLPPLVVYAGAAPGNHIPFLSFLFPFVTFLCVDPRAFDIHETARLQIDRRMFTDDYARALARENGDRLLLFISDIRSFNTDV